MRWGILGAMDFTLSAGQLELQARARAFVRDVLQPREVEFERADGRVPRDWGNPIRRAAIEAGLHGGSLPRVGAPDGGAAPPAVDSIAGTGQFGVGRRTRALHRQPSRPVCTLQAAPPPTAMNPPKKPDTPGRHSRTLGGPRS